MKNEAAPVTPTCRYGHGDLVRSVGEDGGLAEYYVPSTRKNLVNKNWGYGFQIWECRECSYIELHNGEKR